MKIASQTRFKSGLSQYPDWSPKEVRFLDLFVNHSAGVMTPWHGGNFWDTHVPRTGYSEPVIRHAMIALAATHENMAIVRDEIPNDPRMEKSLMDSRKSFALLHYNKSISILARLLSSRQEGAVELALICCVVYIIVDFLWGNVATSIAHLQSGHAILKRRYRNDKPSLAGSLQSNLSTIFDTMGHQAPDEEKEGANDNRSPSSLTDFSDLASARKSIETIATDGLRLARRSAIVGDGPDAVSRKVELEEEEKSIEKELETWLTKFDRFIKSSGDVFTVPEQHEIGIMRLLHLSAVVWLWEGAQPQKEPPLATFSELIDVGDWLILECKNHEDSNRSLRMTLFDSRVWPSFAIIARNCVDQGIKKRALGLLGKAHPRPQTGDGGSATPDDGLNASIPDVTGEGGNWEYWAKIVRD